MYAIDQSRGGQPIPPTHPLNMGHIQPSYPPANQPLSTVPQATMSQTTPGSVSTVSNGRIYSLDVVQQPVRARMCGFGDKVCFSK